MLNLISYCIQILVLVLTSVLASQGTIDINVLNTKEVHTPVSMDTTFVYFGWIIVLFLQFVFVLTSLPCFKPGEHFKNILLLKVKYAFIL